MCVVCGKKPVLNKPVYCKKHFINYFEKKVKKTIKKFNLIKKTDKVVVGASGGKDSMAVLHVLNKLGYNVTALAINEGIKDYRDNTIKLLKEYCKKQKLPLKIVSFKEDFNKNLDEIIEEKDLRPCTVCGVFRRYLLNKYADGFDVLATGHNLDDEAQAVLMNLTKSNIGALKRQGPVSGIRKNDKFTKRVKPLYFCSEKEIMFYSSIKKLVIDFSCCPNISDSFRLRYKRSLNALEKKFPEIKENLVGWYINYKKGLELPSEDIGTCKRCGQPSTNDVCNACVFAEKISA